MAGCGHGHVYPEPNGYKARCGGPAICPKCALDLAQKRQAEFVAEQAAAPPWPDHLIGTALDPRFTAAQAPASVPFCWPIQPQPISLAPVQGCICPPGANRDCQAPACPRKPIPTQGA